MTAAAVDLEVALLDARAQLAVLEAAVRGFVDEHPGYVRALRGARDADYSRWAGNAEARLDLARRLGWEVPA